LPACCCQPAVAGGIIYADLWGELSTNLTLRLCLLRVLLCRSLCYRLSPFQAHWERWHCTCVLRPACLYTTHVGGGSSPLSCGVFLPLALSQAFPLLLAGHVPQLSPEPLRPAKLVYLQFQEGFPSPNLRHSMRPTLLPVCLYCSYCLLLSFSFFPVWRSVCPGGYAALAQACLWEYRGTAKLTWSASSQAIWAWAARRPSWFLHLMWSGDSLHRLEVWRGQSYASSQWFCLQSVSPASLQDFTIGGSLSASSL
jgi:hypothetical protein